MSYFIYNDLPADLSPSYGKEQRLEQKTWQNTKPSLSPSRFEVKKLL